MCLLSTLQKRNKSFVGKKPMIPSSLRCTRYSNLVLEVHTVGYPEQGESIVTFLKDGARVLLTVITDSYKTANTDTVKQILEDNGHPAVNIFIWTHPDEDHSVGIEALLDEFDGGHAATVYMPANLTRDIITCEAAKKAFDYLVNNYNTGQRYHLLSILTVGDQVVTQSGFEIHERLTNRTITGNISFLLPDTSLTMRRSYQGAKNPGDMNDFSLVYVLELNGIHYFFGGDMTKQSMQFIERKDRSYLENIRFVKIPHHGSTEPLKLVDRLTPFQLKKAVATTTVFKATHPYKDTLDKYAEICEHISSTDSGQDSYGSIRLDFSVTRMHVPFSICKGNAKVVRR